MGKITGEEIDRLFKEAVEKTIADNHQKGLPVYQIRKGHIVAIYPDGRVVVLQKAYTSILPSVPHG